MFFLFLFFFVFFLSGVFRCCPFVDPYSYDCRFPSWPVWSPRFSELRVSKRGGLGHHPLPVVAPSVLLLSADGPSSNTSSSSSGIGGNGGVGIGGDVPETTTMVTLRSHSYNSNNQTSPLPRPHCSWKPISPLAVGRQQPLGLTAFKLPSPSEVPLRSFIPPATVAAVAAVIIPIPHDESSLGHARYSWRHHLPHPPTFIILLLLFVVIRLCSMAGVGSSLDTTFSNVTDAFLSRFCSVPIFVSRNVFFFILFYFILFFFCFRFCFCFVVWHFYFSSFGQESE